MLALRHGAGGHVEDERRLVRDRDSDGHRIGTEARVGSAERTLELTYLKGVHSEADTAVWLPNERVLFSASEIAGPDPVGCGEGDAGGTGGLARQPTPRAGNAADAYGNIHP